jgi:hypothetical protein
MQKIVHPATIYPFRCGMLSAWRFQFVSRRRLACGRRRDRQEEYVYEKFGYC